ncbi:MAG: terminase family protein [Dehalococcoidales bacterium]|nr:terminase family protein [Dehalococcoidales bacterium]
MNWAPHPGAQTEFCSRGEFEALFGGSAGPGKTDCLIALVTRYIGKSNYKAILLRRTFPQLQEIIDRCFQRYPALGGVYRSTEHRWYFPSGATIKLGHMQHETDRYNYQGQDYHFVGFDELTQFSEIQYTYLLSRVRTTDHEIPPRVRSTTNPGGVGHQWVKERFVLNAEPGKTYISNAHLADGREVRISRIFIPAKIEDNPTLYLNDPEYMARLEALPEIEKLRLRYGVWDAFEGQFFTELSTTTHGVEPFDVPPEWEKFMVMDWGYSKPFSCGWYAVDYDGRLYRYREWYGCKGNEMDTGLKMPAYEVARGILEREKGEKVRFRIADPSIWNNMPDTRRNEVRGPSVYEDMMAEGVFFMKADNDRIQGWLQVHKRLQLEEDINASTGEIKETPNLFVFNNHKWFWLTMLELKQGKNPDDVETDNQADHIADEVRYACMLKPVRPKKVQRIPQGSFTHERQRMIRAKKYSEKHGVSIDLAYQRIR